MQSIYFRESNRRLRELPPPGSEQFFAEYTYNDGSTTVACYALSIKDRLMALLVGRLWLSIKIGKASVPPVLIQIKRTPFLKPLAAPPVPRAIPQAPEPEKIAGLSSKKTWTVEVVDMQRLIDAVHLRLVPTDVLEARLSILKKLANSGGVVTSRGVDGKPGIPGCKLTEDLSFTVRG